MEYDVYGRRELIILALNRLNYGASAAGAPRFMSATLRGRYRPTGLMNTVLWLLALDFGTTYVVRLSHSTPFSTVYLNSILPSRPGFFLFCYVYGILSTAFCYPW